MSDEPAAPPDPSFAAHEHNQANLAARALVEALHGVGPKGRILTPRGLAGVSDVRSHGPLVVVDGVTEGGEAYRIATHYSEVDYMIVLTDTEIGADVDEAAADSNDGAPTEPDAEA